MRSVTRKVLSAACRPSNSPPPQTALLPMNVRSQCVVRTNGQRLYVGLGGQVFAATPQNGAFELSVPLARGGNQITVVAQAADGGTNMRQVTAVAFGTRVGGFTDPAGYDNGPGQTCTPPTARLTRVPST